VAERVRVSIHQPAYLPYGGFFAKMLSSDLHIVLDTVMYSRQGFQTRNRIRGVQGEKIWLTVPVHGKMHGKKTPALDTLMVDNKTNWSARHWRTLVTTYGKLGTADLAWVRELKQERFVYVAETCLVHLSALLGIDIPIMRASDLKPGTAEQDADQRLIELVTEAGANEYVSGGGGRNYMNLGQWRAAGIGVTFCDWRSPTYPQDPHTDFVPDLSVVDIMARLGPATARELIQEGRTLKAAVT
jgi:WbqC-like protein family